VLLDQAKNDTRTAWSAAVLRLTGFYLALVTSGQRQNRFTIVIRSYFRFEFFDGEFKLEIESFFFVLHGIIL
jgi:hypothetical protein